MRHIVSYFAAECMKHVKQYWEEVLSNYRAGGPVRREYPHDAGMTGKTKATTEGSPVEIKEIKRITNYATADAGGQCVDCGSLSSLYSDVLFSGLNFLPLFLMKSSNRKWVGYSCGIAARPHLLPYSCWCACNNCSSLSILFSSIRFSSCVASCRSSVTQHTQTDHMFTFTCVLLHKEHITAVWRGQCRSLVSEGRLFLVVFCMKSSSANLFGDDSCLPGVSEASNCGSSLARFSSLWCAIMPCKSIRLCSAKISVIDLYFLLMVQSCKTMCRSSSYNGVDSSYSFHVSEKNTLSCQLGARLLPDFNRRGYCSTKSSRANFSGFFNFGTSGGVLFRASSALSRSLVSCCFCRMISQTAVFSLSSRDDMSSVIVVFSCKAMHRSTSRHGADKKCDQCGGRVSSALGLSSTKEEVIRLYRDGAMALMPVCCSIMASLSIRCCSSRKNFSSSGDKSIVISCTAVRRSTSQHGADGFYSFYEVKEPKPGRYRFLGEINRRGYLSRNASSANRFGLVSGGGIKDSRPRCAFSRWRSSMDNAIACNSSLVIVCTRKTMRCSTSYHSTGIFYGCNLRDYSGCFATYCINTNNLMLLCVFKENVGIFRTDFAFITSDHLSTKTAYTDSIPYKTGIGITTPLELEAIHDAPASFFVSAHTHTSTMVGCMGPTSVGLVSSNASCGNPVQSTASELTTSGGGDNPKVRGAFHMAVSARPYFVWRFITFGASDHQIIHVTAWTEREARSRCPSGCVAVFAALIRQEVTHA